jgi:peptidoglycan/LPS O-acetylase OafA/YrhL
VVACLLALGLAALVSPRAFEPVYRLAMPYVVFWLAYRPGGLLRAYNRVGDYSYGVYIYAFPVQQMLVAWFPGLGIWPLTAAAGAITLLLAVLSWHGVESPALRWRHRSRPGRARGDVGSSSGNVQTDEAVTYDARR